MRLPHFIIAACAGAVLVSGSAGSALAQASTTFGDWQATCDNTRVCTLVGMTPEASLGWAHLRIEREGAAGAPARVSIGTNYDGDARTIAVEVKFDDPAFDGVFAGGEVPRGKDGDYTLRLPPQKIEAFLAAMRKAGVLSVRRTDKGAGEDDRATISLKGAMAALRWMDDQQKRAGTVTALVARGDRPASAVSLVPPVPVVRRSRFAVRKIARPVPAAVTVAWKKDCDEWEMAGDAEREGFEIAAGVQLWSVPCSKGAYNFGSMFYLWRGRGPAELISFQIPAGEDRNKGQEELTNAGFDPDSASVSFFSKGRGIGDCGSAGAYVWDGARFRLTRYEWMTLCRGVASDGWPRLWRAQVE